MSSEGYHEPAQLLSDRAKDAHRAVVSLMEEFEAIDWYDQRIEATSDSQLAAVLAHNRDEEKEHAAMVLEWLRRQDPTLDHELRDALFKEGPIVHDHDAADEQPTAPASGVNHDAHGLGIGSLRPTIPTESAEWSPS